MSIIFFSGFSRVPIIEVQIPCRLSNKLPSASNPEKTAPTGGVIRFRRHAGEYLADIRKLGGSGEFVCGIDFALLAPSPSREPL